MTNEQSRWVCEECGWRGNKSEVLTAPNPFDNSEPIDGCPKCYSVNTMRSTCDEPGCWLHGTMGTPRCKMTTTHDENLCPFCGRPERGHDDDCASRPIHKQPAPDCLSPDKLIERVCELERELAKAKDAARHAWNIKMMERESQQDSTELVHTSCVGCTDNGQGCATCFPWHNRAEGVERKNYRAGTPTAQNGVELEGNVNAILP